MAGVSVSRFGSPGLTQAPVRWRLPSGACGCFEGFWFIAGTLNSPQPLQGNKKLVCLVKDPRRSRSLGDCIDSGLYHLKIDTSESRYTFEKRHQFTGNKLIGSPG